MSEEFSFTDKINRSMTTKSMKMQQRSTLSKLVQPKIASGLLHRKNQAVSNYLQKKKKRKIEISIFMFPLNSHLRYTPQMYINIETNFHFRSHE